MTEFSIDRTRAKKLMGMAQSFTEHAAIVRLEEFRGTEEDMRLAASLYERAGDGANAQEILGMLAAETPARRSDRLHELALGAVETLTGHAGAEFEAALADTDPDDDAKALRNDYHSVYEALRSAVRPLGAELRLAKEQRDTEQGAKRLAWAKVEQLEAELKRFKIGAANDASEVAELRGEIRSLSAQIRELVATLNEVGRANG